MALGSHHRQEVSLHPLPFFLKCFPKVTPIPKTGGGGGGGGWKPAGHVEFLSKAKRPGGAGSGAGVLGLGSSDGPPRNDLHEQKSCAS